MAIKELADAALWFIQLGAAATSMHVTCEAKASIKAAKSKVIKRRSLGLRPFEQRNRNLDSENVLAIK